MDLTQFTKINHIIENLNDPDVPLANRIATFLTNLAGIVFYDRATIMFFSKDEKGEYYKHSSFSVNWEKDADVVKTYNEYYCRVDDTLPVFDQPNPVIFRASQFFDPEVRKNNPYWTEYLIPNNCIYSLEGNIPLNTSGNLRGSFNLYRADNKSDFSDEDMATMTLLQPHLSNVLKHYGENLNDSTGLAFMLDNYNCVGIATLDSNCQIIKTNAKYRDLIKNTSYGSEVIAKIISMCVELVPKNNPEGKMSIEYKFEDAPVFLEVSRGSENMESNIQYTCMVYDLSHFITETLNTAKEQYTLSSREFDILQAVLAGESNEEISERLFLSLSTVKKYLASIYSKMHIRSQKQILDKLNLM